MKDTPSYFNVWKHRKRLNKTIFSYADYFMVSLMMERGRLLNNQQDADLAARIQLLEDRASIKNVVDTFSVLADVKDVDTQVLLFTEDAEVKGVDNDGNVQSV